jgi:hypothetical protein
MSYFKNKVTLVLCVVEAINHLKQGSQLTMTITPGQFGDYSVRTAIDGSSVDIDVTKELNTSAQPTNISPGNTQDG